MKKLSNKLKNNDIGKIGEKLAEKYLVSLGYRFIERNWRTNYGEIDLVMLDRNIIVIVEVKTRIDSFSVSSRIFDNIDKRKIIKLRQLASNYYSKKYRSLNKINTSFRIDAVGVILSEDNKPLSISHVKNAF